MSQERAEWNRPRIVASMWWCGDEVCNCTQPQIELRKPNHEAGYPWVRIVGLWKGTFHSEASYEESREQRAELTRAAAQYGIVVDRDLYGMLALR